MPYTILRDYSAAQLAQVHNRYAHKPVAKFETRARAADRTAVALQSAGVSALDGLIAAGLMTPGGGAALNARTIAAKNAWDAAWAPEPEQATLDAAYLAEAEAQVEADRVAELLDSDPAPVPHAMNLAPPAPCFALAELHPELLQGALGLSAHDADWLAALVARALQLGRDGHKRPARAAALASTRAATKSGTARGAAPTPTQQALIDAASRPGGATVHDLMAAAGWPSIAARQVLTNIGNRFGYACSSDHSARPVRHALTAIARAGAAS